MRTTVSFDPDVAVEVERLRRERAEGVSAVVNELIRRGLSVRAPEHEFVQTVSPMRARIDVSNVADVLETLEGPLTR